MRRIIFILLIFLPIWVCAQDLMAEYADVSPNLFGGYDKPVVIAILEFEGGGGIGGRLYEELNKIGELKEEFEFNAHEFLWKNRQILKVSNLDAEDKRVRKALREVLGVSLIVTGEGRSIEEFTMKIIKTEDGGELYSCDYKRSKNSTGIEDAVKLFSEGKKPKYILKQKVNDDNMVYVEGGRFEMGSESGDSDEKPVHTVEVNSFWIGKYEVTQREWKEVMGTDPSYFQGDELPVENVSWEEAVEYCNKLSKKTGKNFRLPTEAEWEYAARGGNKSTRYEYSGSDSIDEVAWYLNNSSSETHPVGKKKANELGIYDMTGNVWEWCSDWYGKDYYSNKQNKNPKGPIKGESNVLRGGSYNFQKGSGRVTYRSANDPTSKFSWQGFRVVYMGEYKKSTGSTGLKDTVKLISENKQTVYKNNPSFKDCGEVSHGFNTYSTVLIGNQCWLKENLDYGTMIKRQENPSDNSNIEKYCYDDISDNCTKYGGLYRWNEAMGYKNSPGTQGICPPGWHIPTVKEFDILVEFVNKNGNKLKETGLGEGTAIGNNESGFSALFPGYRNNDGNFFNLGEHSYIWTSDEQNSNRAYYLDLNSEESTALRISSNKLFGFSVRCLKN